MLKNILGTIGTRLINALITLAVVFFNTRYLGASGVGTAGIIIFDITIIQLFTNFIGGGALIYFTPRAGVFRLFVPACLWTILTTFLAAFLLEATQVVFPEIETIPAGYFWEVVVLALLLSLASVNFIILVGLEKVSQFNYISLLQISLLLVILLYQYLVLKNSELSGYLTALFLSYLSAYLLSLGLLWRYLKPVSLKGMGKLVGQILKYGTYVQFANIFQLLNYRLGLYIVDIFSGRAAVGILYTGQQISESLWLISRSIAMVQFSRISNEDDRAYAVRITLTLAKVTWVITLGAVLILVMLPATLFAFVFGSEFEAIRPVIVSLGAGIVVLSVSIILSQFFSGINKPFHNTISSAIGLFFTVGGGLLLIPSYGLVGAGLSASLSYFASTLYQFIIFIRSTGLPYKSLMITMNDFQIVKNAFLRSRK